MLPRLRKRNASSTSASGEQSRVGNSSPAAAICAFWQKGQCRLQPKLPTDSTILPGWNRRRGFFSMGSSASAVNFP